MIPITKGRMIQQESLRTRINAGSLFPLRVPSCPSWINPAFSFAAWREYQIDVSFLLAPASSLLCASRPTSTGLDSAHRRQLMNELAMRGLTICSIAPFEVNKVPHSEQESRKAILAVQTLSDPSRNSPPSNARNCSPRSPPASNRSSPACETPRRCSRKPRRWSMKAKRVT